MNNQSLVERDQKSCWHPFTQAKTARPPIAIESAFGSYLYTESGKKLFDGISSWWTTAHGHSHPKIAAAISEQAHKLAHTMFANFTHEPAVLLAEQLLAVAPKNLSRVFYSDNGSTAVEAAIKMAIQYHYNRGEERKVIIALEHGYHGDTVGAMSASEKGVFTKPFWPFLFEVKKTPCPSTSDISDQLSEEELTKIYLAKARKLFVLNHDNVAALIIEPMLQGAGGMRISTKGFLRGLKEMCDEFQVLLIADEVATGFFRTGTYFAVEHENVEPDLMCLSKALSGGVLPLSCVLASEKIYQAFFDNDKAKAFLHGHSFTANPIGCAAALASMALFKEGDTATRINDICACFSQHTNEFANMTGVKHARFIGAIFVLELEADDAGYLSNKAQKIADFCFERGLFIRPLGHIIYLMPPYSSTKEEIIWALGLLKEAITDVI